MSTDLLALVRSELGSDGDASRAARACVEQADGFLLHARDVNARLEAAALDRWITPFATLELELLLVADIATERYGADPEVSDDGRFGDQAFYELFWSGHTVTREIIMLLAAGLSTGAYARWRALHEVATRAELIAQAGDQLHATAGRYLDHEAMRFRAELRLNRAWLRSLGDLETITKEHTRLWAELDDEAVSAYGSIFRGDYGWAHELLKMSDDRYKALCETPDRLRGPVFGDLERFVRPEYDDPRWYEVLYSEANAAVHGAPRSAATFTDDGHTLMRRAADPGASEIPVVGAATARRLADVAWACLVHDDGSPIDADADEPWMQLLEVASVIAGRAERAFSEAATDDAEVP